MSKAFRFRVILHLVFSCLFMACAIGCVSRGRLSREDQSSPKHVVRQYLAVELNGARLSTESIQKSILPKIIIPVEYVSPGWDTIFIVTQAKILDVEPVRGREDEIMKVGVRYEVIGEAFGEEVIAKSAVEDYIFEVRRVDDKWFIMDPIDLYPHISQAGFIRHLQGAFGDWKRQIEKARSLTETNPAH